MLNDIDDILKNNSKWAENKLKVDGDFFKRLSKQQKPQYLWIGCSDSRVPANQICSLDPGEVFVHRNVANVVVHSDLNFLSVLQYAVEVLKVKHIIVCGHYGCGGVEAATENMSLGLIDNWLRHIQDIEEKYSKIINLKIDKFKNEPKNTLKNIKNNLMCELNVIQQTINVCRTTIVKDAWELNQDITVNGFIFDIKDGLLKKLGFGVQSSNEVDIFQKKSINELD